jgi:hypothetical protein
VLYAMNAVIAVAPANIARVVLLFHSKLCVMLRDSGYQ